MALSANKDMKVKPDEILDMDIEDNVHVYRAAMVCVDPATGYALPAADVAGYTFEGVAIEECNNTLVGHVAGGKHFRVRREGSHEVTTVGAAQSWVGQPAYITDDDACALAGNVLVGKFSEYISATLMRVSFSCHK